MELILAEQQVIQYYFRSSAFVNYNAYVGEPSNHTNFILCSVETTTIN